MKSELERAAEFEEALRDACAERLVPSRFGTAVFNDSLPRVWSLNVLRVEERAGGADALAAEAERLQGEAGLTHRRVLVTGGEAGRRLEAPFTDLGWTTDAFVFMVPRREPARPVDATVAVEVQSDLMPPLRRRILEEWLTDAQEETVRQIAESDRLFGEAAHARHFAVVVDGVAVSAAALFSDGRTAQIEDVATLPEQRGHGYASAVVVHALREARATGHDFVFLIADARSWPKELYRRLGFDPVGEKYAFLLSEVSEARRPETDAT